MYSVESLRDSLTRLYRDGADHDWDEDRIEELLDSIDYGLLIQAVRHKAETVYAYTTNGIPPKSFNYRGVDLFGQRATRLLVSFDQSSASEVLAIRSYELWLLEDMSFAAVSCVTVDYGDGAYETCYRTVKDCDPWDSGIDLDLDDLTDVLDVLCYPVFERKQPVYEL